MLVVIPYIKSKAQGNELYYAITGWNKFAQFKHKIIVIGDKEDYLDKFDNVTHIPFNKEYTYTDQYIPAIDVARKLKLICDKYYYEDEFIWTADDIYPIKSFTLEDLRCNYFLLKNGKYASGKYKDTYNYCMTKTCAILIGQGKRTTNYNNHFPFIYNISKLKTLIDLFDLTHESYLIQTLYCNFYNKIDGDIHIDNIRKIVLSNEEEIQIKEDQKFIVNTVKGFSDKLYILLDEIYGIRKE